MKKYLLYGMVGFVLMSIIIGMLSKELKEPADLTKEVLPDISIWRLDSTQMALQSIEYDKGLVVALINSECEICHAQVDEFYKRADKLGDARIILLSYQDIPDIKEFAEKYPNPPFSFWKVEYEVLDQYFEGWSTPQTFVYNDMMRMVKKIDGVSRIVHIKKSLE